MAKVRGKAYKRGDSFTVKIPSDIDETTLKWINSQKFISPSVIEALNKIAKSVYSEIQND
jgi:hypothetical protein